jgi:hypothetical protein
MLSKWKYWKGEGGNPQQSSQSKASLYVDFCSMASHLRQYYQTQNCRGKKWNHEHVPAHFGWTNQDLTDSWRDWHGRIIYRRKVRFPNNRKRSHYTYAYRSLGRPPPFPLVPSWLSGAVAPLVICLLYVLLPYRFSWCGRILNFYEYFLFGHCCQDRAETKILVLIFC